MAYSKPREKNWGVDHHSIQGICFLFISDGPTGLLNQPKTNLVPKRFKKYLLINDYLNGEGSTSGYLHQNTEFFHTQTAFKLD